MYLKSLTLKGFKSFASSTTLELEPGITCIVGPNGSGKSNVVDALAWVMGEQGAKSLRGGKMEDVIFAGTSGRPPLGRAEVQLTIDNADGALPIEYAEVTISRTMFRNGGSEYAINSQPCRLLDVQELLSDSGIGREMHVIVGQGQLDTILHATPEDRRGFIEEAAGVLKHRKRKEKALRKLDSTEGNLTRLSDLLGEIRRQLKPLGRQAEVARRAQSVQADVRDARARLMADDMVAARTALEQELADESVLLERRTEVEAALAATRETEAALEAALREDLPALARAQETWFGLSSLRERLRGTAGLAAERVRNAASQPEVPAGRDPVELEAEAARVRAQEKEIDAEVAENRTALDGAVSARQAAELAFAEEERRVAGLQRAAADRREGMARLHGQVNGLRSRAAAAEEEVGRLTQARAEIVSRAERAQHDFTSLESRVAGLDAGEEGLDAEHEAASAVLSDIEDRLAKNREELTAAERERSSLSARKEALELGLNRKDGAGALLAATDSVNGMLGSVAALLSVQQGFEAAVAAALGSAADAVAVRDVDSAIGAIAHLKDDDLGRAGILLGGAEVDDAAWPGLPSGATYAMDVVECPEDLRPALARLLHKVVVVDDLATARGLVRDAADLTAVTRDGDLIGAHFAAGGSSSQPSLIEVQAAVDEATAALGHGGAHPGAAHLRRLDARARARGGPASRRCRPGQAARVRRHAGCGRRGAGPVQLPGPQRQGRGGPARPGDRGREDRPRQGSRGSRRARGTAGRGRGVARGGAGHHRAGAPRRGLAHRPRRRDGHAPGPAHDRGACPGPARSRRHAARGGAGRARGPRSSDRAPRAAAARGAGRRGRGSWGRRRARAAGGVGRAGLRRAHPRGAEPHEPRAGAPGSTRAPA